MVINVHKVAQMVNMEMELQVDVKIVIQPVVLVMLLILIIVNPAAVLDFNLAQHVLLIVLLAIINIQHISYGG